MPSGFNLRQKDISVGSGLNIEYSSTGPGVTLSMSSENQDKLDSIVFASDFTFTQADISNNMIVKDSTTIGVPAGSMVQLLSNTGIVMTERAGILVYWEGNNLKIDFTGYFNTTQTTISGTWTVKFAGNFVGGGGGGGGTTPSATIAGPVLLTRPTYSDALHLEMLCALQDDYSDAQTIIDTKTVTGDRALVKAFGGTSWIACPDDGFGSLFNKAPVKVILSSKLDTTKIYNLKYRWVSMTSDTSVSDWYGMVYPCCTEPMI